MSPLRDEAAACAMSLALALAIAGCDDAGPRDASRAAAPRGDAVAFTDVSGVRGERDIATLARLGVFDRSAGAFRPTDPIARREFARWLFKTVNALGSARAARAIVPAPRSGAAAFADVPQTDPDFPFVEGLREAGVSIACAPRAFCPDAFLSWKAMLAMKASLDRRQAAAPRARRNEGGSRLQRVTARPQRERLATRAEAATILNVAPATHAAP